MGLFDKFAKLAAERATVITSTPSSASDTAMARPNPLLAPSTRAVLPSSCRSMAVLRNSDLRAAWQHFLRCAPDSMGEVGVMPARESRQDKRSKALATKSLPRRKPTGSTL